MALKETTSQLHSLLTGVVRDLEKGSKGNKAASQRVRTGTVKLEKVAKLYRKESIASEKVAKTKKKASPAVKEAARKMPATKRKSTRKSSTATKSRSKRTKR